ncbi:HD domain-containing protein [Actinomadura harenae]|uniref:HD domain-containing protein n=1 Tax=Actinomadura harenae TaxID=2483351 RepID=A0A3M2M5C1_9ACTN|nr:HD domain-containing protein [Actinomadura harenae]RMI44200.1 HD domain-containing protein [Actinomadura harenae]
MRVPSDGEIRGLHEKHAPSAEAFELVFTHCEIVARIAGQFSDSPLVRAGALLHDIGVYRLYGPDGRLDSADYIRHGVLGEELLREEGLPEALCRFCSHHTGVGLTCADVREQGLPLPEADFLAETDEEAVVMYADKFHSKSTPPVFVSAATYTVKVGRFGEDKALAFKAMRERFGDPRLDVLAGEYGFAII